MPIYKMAYRDGDNPETSKLHVNVYFCEAETKKEALKIFETNLGYKWVLAGPIGVDADKVPSDATFVTMPNS